jgi:predicted site-specific integrase-resolvase
MTPDNPLEDITVEVVCTAKAARMLGMHERTITRWCRQGKLEGAEQFSEQRASKWLIPVASLRKYRLLRQP